MTNRLYVVILWFATAAIVSCGSAGKSPTGGRPEKPLPEWETNFTFNGNPIHPAIIHAFEGWISDAGPIVVAVDVASAEGTNQYSRPVYRHQDFVGCTLPDTEPEESYGYRWVGRMADGTHVVRGTLMTGGTGKFETLFFFRFSVDDGYAVPGPSRQQRVILNVTGWHSLGDRADPQVTIVDDHVDVIPQSAFENHFAGNATAATLYPSGKKNR
jgi:hypothetical protein